MRVITSISARGYAGRFSAKEGSLHPGRNLLAAERTRLALELKPLIEKQAKKRQQDAGGAVPLKSTEPPVDTRKEIAKIAGVGADTVRKVEAIERDAQGT